MFFFFFYGNVLVFLKTIDRLQFRCSMKTKSSWILGGQQKILEFNTHNLKHLTTAALDILNKTILCAISRMLCSISLRIPTPCYQLYQKYIQHQMLKYSTQISICIYIYMHISKIIAFTK